MKKRYEIIAVRHGQSQWNLENRFTGWANVPLSENGMREAKSAGKLLCALGYDFDLVHTSLLKRAIKTSWIILEELGLEALEEKKFWRLNERHYGGLSGKDKNEARKEFGEEQVHIWRRSYDTPPPENKDWQEEIAQISPLRNHYDDCNLELALRGESLKDTFLRVVPYFENHLKVDIVSKKRVLISAHGNSLRALIKYLCEISDEKITELEIPTGVPISISLDPETMKASEYQFLN